MWTQVILAVVLVQIARVNATTTGLCNQEVQAAVCKCYQSAGAGGCDASHTGTCNKKSSCERPAKTCLVRELSRYSSCNQAKTMMNALVRQGFTSSSSGSVVVNENKYQHAYAPSNAGGSYSSSSSVRGSSSSFYGGGNGAAVSHIQSSVIFLLMTVLFAILHI
ncbi:unnamed protein product [Calicophoron daubneyi]|uniref:Secreted protein n=1 Tax=Calicophoron daubneyi TaxID=300641 RepID=A0AAV2TSH5_CALDB